MDWTWLLEIGQADHHRGSMIIFTFSSALDFCCFYIFDWKPVMHIAAMHSAYKLLVLWLVHGMLHFLHWWGKWTENQTDHEDLKVKIWHRLILSHYCRWTGRTWRSRTWAWMSPISSQFINDMRVCIVMLSITFQFNLLYFGRLVSIYT